MTRAADHLAEVRRRLVRSRYEPDAAALDRLLSAGTPAEVWTRPSSAGDLPDVRLLPPTALRVATDPLDLERSAEVLSAVLDADLDVVRRHLGGNLRHVDGASTLLAVRWQENVIGTVTLVLTEDEDGMVAGVHALAVAAPFRGRGIGTALAARATELGVAAGADLAVATTRGDDHGVLSRLGFERAGPTTAD